MNSNSELHLYDYFRSSASYRVRIALNYKNLSYQQHSVHLLKEGGQQFLPSYQKINPQSRVPTLIDGANIILQSLAIIEYLEETHPQPALLPKDPISRAWVRSFAQVIACDMQALQNVRLTRYLTEELKITEAQKQQWYQHWLPQGLEALEQLVTRHEDSGLCCHGDTPTLADMCLIPQLFGAQRFGCDLTPYPRLNKINDYCLRLPAFAKAHPSQQPDAE